MSAAAATRDVFVVCPATELDAERHAVMAVPTEGSKNGGHRVPIRAAADGAANPIFVPGTHRVAQSAGGLRRLLVKFPESYCHSIKEHAVTLEGDRANLSLGFALFDPRAGPTEEEERVMKNIDAFSDWVKSTMVGCERIRTVVGLGAANMNEAKQRMVAEHIDLCVSKPAAEPAPHHNHNKSSEPPRPRGRYCYVKIVPPSPTVSELFLTYWWAPNGTPMSLDTVRRMQNFRVVPFVEMEDVYCNKALRSLQMKLRECIVIPPTERPTQRFSAAFPQRVCVRDLSVEDDGIAPEPIAAIEEEEEEAAATPAKRQKRIADSPRSASPSAVVIKTAETTPKSAAVAEEVQDDPTAEEEEEEDEEEEH